MRWTRFSLSAFFAAVLVACIPALQAQSTTSGYVTGSVTDASKAAIRGAAVKLQNTGTSLNLATTSGDDGTYHFDFVPPGSYKLHVEAAGFTAWEEALNVNVGQSANVNAELAVASAATTVQVAAEGVALETEDGNVSSSFNEKQIQYVPNPGQDLTYVAQVAPGVVMNTQAGGGNFSSFGLPGYSNMFTINGMDYLNSFADNNKSGATNDSIGANEMQSVTVVNNGYSGNYGRLVGSNVNYVTKSGSNEVHGNAIYEWNGSSLNANNFFNNRNDTPRPFDNVNQWAASIGGPIWKNRTFFFVNNEGLRIVLPTSASANIPSPQFQAATLANLQAVSPGAIPFYQKMFALYNGAPGASRATDSLTDGGCGSAAFEQTIGGPCALQFQATPGNFTGEWLVSWRIDQILSSKDQIYLHIFTDHGIQATNTDVINQVFNQASPQPEWQGQLNETHIFQNRAVNQFIGAFQWSGILFGPSNYPAALDAFPAKLTFSDGSLHYLGQNQAEPVGRHITQYQFVDDFSITWGKHTFKAGVDFLRDDLNVFQYGNQTAGTITTSLLDFYNGGGASTSYLKSFPTASHRGFAAYDLGFYGEDDWAIRPGLKLTLALRFDRQSNSNCPSNCFARLAAPFEDTNHDPSIPYNQAIQTGVSQAFYSATPIAVEPRLGFAWSPFGSKDTVVRGGIGNFRDFIPQQSLQGFALNSPNVNSFNVTGNLSPDVGDNIFSNSSNSNTTFLRGFSQGATLGDLLATDPGFSPPALYGAQKQTRNPTYLEWNFELQHAFGQATTMSLNYVGNHGVHEIFINPSQNAYAAAGFAGLPSAVPDTRCGPVTELQSDATSQYHGLIASIRHNFAHTFQATASYTWSHAMDDVTDNGFTAWGYGTAASLQYPQIPSDPHANYGDNDADARHTFTASYVWTPAIDAWAAPVPKLLTSGWSVAGTFVTRTGFPFTVIDGATTGNLTATNYGATVFADYAGGAQPSCSNPNQPCLVSGDFSSAANGFGLQRRNLFRGPGYFNTDLSLLKTTKVHLFHEGQSFVFGASFFNLLNHPNFDQPVNNISNTGQFGRIIATVSPPTSVLGSGLGGDSSPRQIQLIAKFIF
ncbi:MAG: carboxypeptidase regulatory-like domain-containing protein [Acidobacteriaceae bacterium]